MKELKISEGWLKIMKNGMKSYDIRIGRRGFEIGDNVTFIENNTGDSLNAVIVFVVKSWEAPKEWKWNDMPDFEVISFKVVK